MPRLSPYQVVMLQHQLRDIVGPENVVIDPDDLKIYGVDHFWIPRLLVSKDFDLPVPDVVVLPGSAQEVAEVISLAQRLRVPVTPWGGGSGSQGGIMPVDGGITVDLKRLNRVVDLDETSGTITAEAGINGWELEAWLNERGWTLPHYPASIATATLGGYLAARGSGVLSTKYGKAEDMALSIEVVLPDGDIASTLPVNNHAAGPGLLQLFIGAEGSLGIITKATMRIERHPEARRFRAVLLPEVSTGLDVGRQIMLNRLDPSVIRLYDEVSTQKVAARTLKREINEGAWMVLTFEGHAEIAEAQEKRALDLVSTAGGEDLGPEPGQHWWDHRYDFYFPPNWYDLPALFGTTDTVATFSNMEKLWRARREILPSKYAEWGLDYFAHFSHWFPWGVMIYDRFAITNPPEDAAEAAFLHNEIWDTAVRIALENGGVINEHHGVGTKLARFVREQYGSGFRLIEGAKREIDPAGVLNPGKMGFGPTV